VTEAGAKEVTQNEDQRGNCRRGQGEMSKPRPASWEDLIDETNLRFAAEALLEWQSVVLCGDNVWSMTTVRAPENVERMRSLMLHMGATEQTVGGV
jgi:hypothetical protein